MNLAGLTARMPALLKTRAAALAAIAILQIGILGSMVAGRVRLLQTGREIVLPIQPVDPRDLFKGDYVRLGYTISSVPFQALAGNEPRYGKPAYVTIEPQADGNWSVARLTARYPDQVPTGHIVLKARHERWADWSHWPSRVRYGLERYYVPEGKGPGIEKLARDKKLAAIVAVDARGNAAIKGLSIDGQRVYDEPLF